MFNVDLKAVVSTFDTESLTQFYISEGTSNFFSPITYAVKESDVNLKLALAQCVGDMLEVDYTTLRPSFCGLGKLGDTIDIIYYIKMPANFKPVENYHLITGNKAKESEYVRKVEVFI